MSPRPTLRRTFEWDKFGGPIATLLLVLSPLWLMAAFAVSSLLVYKGLAWQIVAIACVPFLVLGAGAGLMCLWTRPRRGPLFMIIPAACLASLHARDLIHNAAAVAPPPYDGVSFEQVLSMGYIASGMLFGLLALGWVALVITKARFRWTRKSPAGLCPTCRYDRTGLAPGAVCPECGSIPT